jgi:hypothetical protein
MLDRIRYHGSFLIKMSILLLLLVLSRGQEESLKPIESNLVTNNFSSEKLSKSAESGFLENFTKKVDNYLK